MKYHIFILLLASVSFLGVPHALAISPALSLDEINPKVRAYEQASSSGESTGNETTKSAVVVFPVKTLKKLTDRLHASVFRIESIRSRITARVAKMQKNGIKVTKINTKLTTFAKQFNLLKNEMEINDKLAASLFISVDQKNDYSAFRSEVADLRGLLNDSLVSEKAIIADMKALEPVQMIPTVSKTVINKK